MTSFASDVLRELDLREKIALRVRERSTPPDVPEADRDLLACGVNLSERARDVAVCARCRRPYVPDPLAHTWVKRWRTMCPGCAA